MNACKKNQNVCKYCGQHQDNVCIFHCIRCKSWVHSFCLKEGSPSKVRNDNYFDFVCCHCSLTNKEHFNRHHLKWIQAVYLTLYNLSKNDQFHYIHLVDIVKYMNRHRFSLWSDGSGGEIIQTSFNSSLSAGLTNNLFESGYEVYKKKGWWKIRDLKKSPSFDPNKMPFIKSSRNARRASQNYKAAAIKTVSCSEPPKSHKMISTDEPTLDVQCDDVYIDFKFIDEEDDLFARTYYQRVHKIKDMFSKVQSRQFAAPRMYRTSNGREMMVRAVKTSAVEKSCFVNVVDFFPTVLKRWKCVDVSNVSLHWKAEKHFLISIAVDDELRYRPLCDAKLAYS